MLDANRPRDQTRQPSTYKLWAEPCERQSAVAVPMHIFGRLIALFATKPSQGLAMIDS